MAGASEAAGGRRRGAFRLGWLWMLGGILWAGAAGAAFPPASEDSCRACHDGTADVHHLLALCEGFECLDCHRLRSASGPLYEFEEFRDCLVCHADEPHVLSCMLCHPNRRFSDYLGEGREIHRKHMDRVVCGVCHVIPDVVDWGSRESACGNLCHGGERIESAQRIHRIHMDRFKTVPVPCNWCHGRAVPERPADVCDLCHPDRSGGARAAHDRHAEDDFECTVCHAAVAGFPDVRAASRSAVCTLCHDPKGGDAREIHKKHVFDKAQCYACHGEANVYASFRGDLDCSICHGPEDEPFYEVHEKHAGHAVLCTVCHAVVPPNVEGTRWKPPASCEVRSPAEGRNEARTATVTASGSDGEAFAAAHAADGRLDTCWRQSAGSSAWVTVDLGRRSRVDEVSIWWRDYFSPSSEVAFEVLASADGSRWEPAKVEGGDDRVAARVKLDDDSIRYLKILLEGDEGYQICEVEVFE
ncbi:MAG: hypothetical protein Kow0092_17710 [Deferrisomatales bacterium]